MNQKARSGNYTDEMQTPSRKSDLDLVRQIAVREEDAVEELYHRYHLPIFNYFLRMTQDAGSAEDLLQEVFMGVWEGAGRFQARASVKTWMFRIAHFQFASWLRNHKTLPDSQPTESFETLADLEDSLESLVFQQWNFSHIQKAMTQLSSNHREVIEFTFTYGLSYTEIAHILDSPVGTIKSRLHKALRQLNGILTAKGIVSKD